MLLLAPSTTSVEALPPSPAWMETYRLFVAGFTVRFRLTPSGDVGTVSTGVVCPVTASIKKTWPPEAP
jgi:hypothetical protein